MRELLTKPGISNEALLHLISLQNKGTYPRYKSLLLQYITNSSILYQEAGNKGADVAGNRVMDLLKELEVARKEREVDPVAGAPTGESKDIGESENSKSVVGG